MDNILVSIIISLYNTEKYIKECLDSIVNQTYHNLEIIIVDDCSTDNSVNIIKENFLSDKRIKIISLKKNKGLANSRKEGVKNSHGEYLMFVDADDWLSLDVVQICIDEILKNNSEVVRYGMIREIVAENRKKNCDTPFLEKKVISRDKFKEELYPIIFETYTLNSLCTQLVKREILSEEMINEKITMGEDLYCSIRIFDKINKFSFIPGFYYHYRYHDSSITSKITKENIDKKIDDVIKVYSDFFYYAKKWQMGENYNKLVSFRVLDEITKQFCSIFLIKGIKNTHIKSLFKRIVNDDSMTIIRENISKKDLKNSNYKNKKLMTYIYDNNIKKMLFEGNFIYKNKVKLKRIVKVILKKMRNL